MADAGKSDQEIFDMMIKFHIEVLRRRYNHSYEDIQRLHDEMEAQLQARKRSLNTQDDAID